MRSVSLFIFLLLAQGMFAQRAFRGGIMAGGVTSQMSGDGLGGWDKFGITGGAWVQMPLSGASSLALQMKYINKGSRTPRDTVNNTSYGYYLNYIEVPLMYSFELARKDRSSFQFMLGPYAAVLLNQKVKFNGGEYDVQIPFNKYDIGLHAEVQWWPSSNFYLSASGNSSVTPIRPNPSQANKNSYYERGNYNSCLQLIAGFRFGGGNSGASGR